MTIVDRILKSERLTFEPLTAANALQMLAYFERNRDYLKPWEPARSPAFYTLERQREDIARFRDEMQQGTGVRFIALEPGTNDIAVSINLSNIRAGVIHAAIVSYAVDERCAGRGYASEALRTVVRYAFDVLNLHRLDASYQPTNYASGRVLEKIGFVIEGRARQYLFLDGAWRDSVLVSLMNERWKPPA